MTDQSEGGRSEGGDGRREGSLSEGGGGLGRFFSGGIGSCIAKTCTAPLSRVTILLQTSTLQFPVTLRCPEFVLQTDGVYYYAYRSPSEGAGVVRSLRMVLSQEGVRALWRGNLASCLHRFPYSGMAFFVQDGLKRRLGLGEFWAGAVAGAVAATTAYPLDMVKTRMTTDPRVGGVGETVRVIVRERGVTGLYRGLLPTLAHVAPSLAISFEVYATLKRKVEVARESQWRANLMCGCASGLVSAVLLFPVDLVRRRLQLAQTDVTLAECVAEVRRKRGFFGFYRGLQAELLKVVPYVGVMFMTVEYLTLL
jgi:solute carrier family 25 phosphate transporter 23/24/25/41